MTSALAISIVLINAALLFYSLGVWAERISRYLKRWHVVGFWIGFAFDVSGTTAMHFNSDNPFDITNLHTLTGQIALWLMCFHAAWATRVIKKDNKEVRSQFHRFSVFVWLVWLIPYLGGVIIGVKG